MNKKLRQKLYGAVLFFAPYSLMADDFKSGLCKMMGLGATFAFFLCVFFSVEGIIHWKQGGSFIKDIIGVIITASAIPLGQKISQSYGYTTTK